MKKIIYAVFFLFIFLMGNALLTIGQGFSPSVQHHLEKIIDSFQKNPVNPFIGGMSVAIKVDQLANWEGASGYAARNIDSNNNPIGGGSPFTTNTISRIYSVTKTFTAALVLELVKEGWFNLGDSVSKFVPLAVINPLLNPNVTVRQLLAHKSGYSDYTAEFNLQVAVAAHPTHIWTPFEMLTFVHQQNAPGAVLHYSSTNYILLGVIIEKVTGKPVEDLYRKRFFEPLGLDSMFLAIREKNLTHLRIASGHDNISPFNPVFQQTGQSLFPDTFTNIKRFPLTAINSLAFTGGAIISNARALANWSSYLFSGRATGKTILDTMLRSISAAPDEDGDRLGYGLILSTKIGRDTFIGHDGNAPGYRSVMFFQPEKKLSLVILTNYHGADIYAIARALYKSIPDFTCGDKKFDNVSVCFWGKSICVPRFAATWLISYGGILGDCEAPASLARSTAFQGSKLNKPGAELTFGAFPNPFRSTLSFSFRATEPGFVSLQLYDVNGKLLNTIFKGFASKGVLKNVTFNASGLPAGIYISRLQTPSGSKEQKLVRNR